jgi:hypothetical protein
MKLPPGLDNPRRRQGGAARPEELHFAEDEPSISAEFPIYKPMSGDSLIKKG